MRDETTNRYAALKAVYDQEKASLVASGEEVIVKGPGRHTTTWKVIGDVPMSEVHPLTEYHKELGVKGFDFSANNRTVYESEVMDTEDGRPRKKRHKLCRINFLELIMHLWGDDDNNRGHLLRMNKSREKVSLQMYPGGRKGKPQEITPFTQQEYWIGWGLVVSCRTVGFESGEQMWLKAKPSEEVTVQNFVKPFNPAKFMTLRRFQEWKACVTHIYAHESQSDDDPWWMISAGLDEQRRNRQRTIAFSIVKVLDEIMSAFAPQATKTGNLPHLSYILRKPEPLGTEFKCALCCTLLVFLYLDLCRRKNDEYGESRKYSTQTKMKTAQVSLTLMEKSKVIRASDDKYTNPHASPDVYLGDSWFTSVELAVLTQKIHNSHYVGVLKTNSGRSPKAFIESKMSQWPGGSYLNLMATVDNVEIVATGYKYNSSKVLTFIWTRGAGHTEPGNPYVAKWKDRNGNNAERLIPRPSIVSFYFERSNGIDVANMMRQDTLRLEKCWVTQDGYFRILTSLMGSNIVDAWRLYLHHCRNNHRHRNITLIDFSSMLAHDMLTNSLEDQEDLQDSFSISPPQAIHNSAQQTVSQQTLSKVMEEYDRKLKETIVRHTLLKTDEKEKRKNNLFRTKRAICSMSGCKCTTSMFCPQCPVPKGRDKAWICGNCEPDHKARYMAQQRHI